jgi:hypothetical protein
MHRNRKKIPTSQESNSTLWQKITRFRDACWELNYHSIERHGAWSKEHREMKITKTRIEKKHEKLAAKYHKIFGRRYQSVYPVKFVRLFNWGRLHIEDRKDFFDTGFALFTPLNSKTIQLGRNTRITRFT